MIINYLLFEHFYHYLNKRSTEIVALENELINVLDTRFICHKNLFPRLISSFFYKYKHKILFLIEYKITYVSVVCWFIIIIASNISHGTIL